jgi:diacylglycerol kinase (ATP)
MPAARVAVVANPAAGRGRGGRALATVQTLAAARGVPLEVWATTRPGEAADLAAEAAADGASVVVALGGDGTVRDVAEGLLRAASGPALGVIPVGTGNDLARTLGLPRDPAAAFDLAVGEREQPLDAWLWNQTPFVNVAGVGLDAAVAEVVNSRFRRLRGPLPYIAGMLAVLPRFRPFPLEVRGPEGEWSGRAWLAAFGNGACYGGGMRIAPAARTDDGLLSVVVVGEVSRLELLRQFPRIFAGTHVSHPRVATLALSRASVVAPLPRPTLDGELLGALPAEVRMGGRLRVRA